MVGENLNKNHSTRNGVITLQNVIQCVSVIVPIVGLTFHICEDGFFVMKQFNLTHPDTENYFIIVTFGLMLH